MGRAKVAHVNGLPQEVEANLAEALELSRVLDNTRVMHGRMSFTDPRRELYSRMGRHVDW